MDLLEKLFSKHINKFRSLETKLKNISEVRLNDASAKELKSRVMHAVNFGKPVEENFFVALTEKIKNLASQIQPSAYFRSMLKEKMEVIVESGRHSKWASASMYRRTFASALAVIFVVGVFFNFGYRVNRAEASVMTIIDQISGNVTVVRDNKILIAEPGLLLLADDTIKTGPGSRAIIRFLDQSVSRLDENTDVKISKLYVNPNNKTETIVEIIIERGRIWSRVVNLINDVSKFQVKAQNTIAVAKKKAAFDVKIPAGGSAKISAIQNHVDLVVATNKTVVETTLVKGFAAEQGTIKNTEVLEDAWITDNLEKDRVYIESVKKDVQNSFNPVHAVQQLTNDTQIVLTIDDVSKQLKILNAAKSILADARVYLEKGEIQKAQDTLNYFKSQIESVSNWAKENQAKNPAGAASVSSQLQEMLDSYQKQLSLLLPADSLYLIKQTVSEARVIIATTPNKKTEERLSQASSKLLEVQDLIEQGDTAAATRQVQEYNKAISDVVTDIKQLPIDQKEKAVTAILNTKAEDLKALEAASTTSMPTMPTQTQVTPPTSLELQQTITDAKTESLSKVGEVVLDAQMGQPSASILKGVETMNNIEVNGKSVIDLKISNDGIMIRTEATQIDVIQSETSTTTTITSPTTNTSVTTPLKLIPAILTTPLPTTN